MTESFFFKWTTPLMICSSAAIFWKLNVLAHTIKRRKGSNAFFIRHISLYVTSSSISISKIWYIMSESTGN